MEKSFNERVTEATLEVKALKPQEANEVKSILPDAVFIDPRSAEDIKATTGIIPGAINVPLDALSEGEGAQLIESIASRSQTIIASCQGGPMGALAAYALKKRGFNNVYFIDGGTQGWLDAGYTTV